MNTHELIESTMLHALGLLDDSERQAYEAAFAAAPSSVQQRVREESRRMADLGSLLPDIEPAGELRPMVLAAVRAAMRQDANELRLSRSNGRLGVSDAPASGSPVVGRIDPAQTRSGARATSQPRLSSSPRVNRAWRVAAIGLAAASIALGVVTISMQRTYEQAQSKALVTNLYDTIGAKYLESTIFDGNTQRVALTSSESRTSAVAAVWANPDWDTARLFVKNLAADRSETYRLVVLDGEGNIVREIKTFTPTGEFEDFDVDVNLSTERSLAIYPGMVQDIKNAEPVLVSTKDTL